MAIPLIMVANVLGTGFRRYSTRITCAQNSTQAFTGFYNSLNVGSASPEVFYKNGRPLGAIITRPSSGNLEIDFEKELLYTIPPPGPGNVYAPLPADFFKFIETPLGKFYSHEADLVNLAGAAVRWTWYNVGHFSVGQTFTLTVVG